MPRIRTIKPEFFDDPAIGELTPLARLFFIGLWTQADSAGRLVDDMRRLKARLFPYDGVEVEPLAVELHGKDMIRRYTVDGRRYLWIRNFTRHQRPHPKEPKSVIPPFDAECVEKHGEPKKETADLLDSGSLNLDPGIEQAAAAPRVAPVENPTDNVGVITKIAHEVMDQIGPNHGDLTEAVKALCAMRHVAYNGSAVGSAIMSASFQRRLHKKRA